MATICVFLMGTEELAQSILRLFASRLGPAVQCEPVRISAGETPRRDLSDYAGIVVSGSRHMVTERLPWSEACGKVLRKVVEEDTVPLLAVCYGHQLLAQEFGGEVDYIKQPQLGPQDCFPLPAIESDPLFACLSGRELLAFNVAHRQSVMNLPPGPQLLVSSAVDPHYAVRWGPRQWSTQFHPEFRTEVVRKMLSTNRDALAQSGMDVDSALSKCHRNDDGAAILGRFAEICLKKTTTSKL